MLEVSLGKGPDEKEAPFLEVNSHEVKKSLALQCLGYAFLIRESIQAEVESGKLVRIPTPGPLRAPIYRVARRDRPLSTSSQAFFKMPAKKPSPFGAR